MREKRDAQTGGGEESGRRRRISGEAGPANASKPWMRGTLRVELTIELAPLNEQLPTQFHSALRRSRGEHRLIVSIIRVGNNMFYASEKPWHRDSRVDFLSLGDSFALRWGCPHVLASFFSQPVENPTLGTAFWQRRLCATR